MINKKDIGVYPFIIPEVDFLFLSALEKCELRGYPFLHLPSKGVEIGNPLSSFLSDIFMDKIENDLHSKGLRPKILSRYVDDSFLHFP